jgi:hypothetical protein
VQKPTPPKAELCKMNESKEKQEAPEIELAKEEVYEAAMELHAAQEKFNSAVVNVHVTRCVWHVNAHPDEYDDKMNWCGKRARRRRARGMRKTKGQD